MNIVRTHLTKILTCTVLALCAESAPATAVQDLVRVKGHEKNILVGMGIVVGLNGTGDTSKSSFVAARPFGKLLSNLGNPIADLTELAKADAYAIVTVTMEVPAAGVREGDVLDVSVDKLFNAESLAGGRLFPSLLRPPGPDSPNLPTMAIAQGSLIIETDNPGSATIRNGGQMLKDIRTSVLSRSGSMTLVLKDQYAGYPVAITIEASINDEFAFEGLSNVARVEDAKNIRIQLPEADLRRPAQFIASLLTIPIDPSLIRTEARIVINEKAGIIAVKGDVEIGPVGIAHKGMQLTNIAPAPMPDAGAPAGSGRWAPLDTTDGTSRSSTKLIELLRALDRLNVSVDDQIAIIYELKKTGSLHAEIVSE